jgi:hypothetical protein
MPAPQAPSSFTLPTRPTFPTPAVPPTPHQKIEKQAQKLVADTFYGTLMRQMHDSPFKSELFSGGRGGQAFQGLLDQKLSDHMAAATHNPLVHAITHTLERPRNANGQLIHEAYQQHPRPRVSALQHLSA